MSRSSDSLVASVFAQFYNSFREKWTCLAVEHIYAKHDGKNIFAEVSENGIFHSSHRGFSKAAAGDTCMRLKHKNQKYSDIDFEKIILINLFRKIF